MNLLSIPGLFAWYDASDSATVTLDNRRVVEWRDKSGNSRHVLQTDTGLQPAYISAALNGLNVVGFLFNKLVTAQSFQFDDLSVFVVFRENDAGEYERIIDIGGVDGVFISRNISNENQYLAGVKSNVPPYGSVLALTDNFPHIISLVRSDTVVNAHGDGGAVVNYFAQSGTTVLSPLALGARADALTFNRMTSGYIAEVVVYSAALTEADRQSVEGYLAHKWGLTGNLPAGHPYKSTEPFQSTFSGQYDYDCGGVPERVVVYRRAASGDLQIIAQLTPDATGAWSALVSYGTYGVIALAPGKAPFIAEGYTLP